MRKFNKQEFVSMHREKSRPKYGIEISKSDFGAKWNFLKNKSTLRSKTKALIIMELLLLWVFSCIPFEHTPRMIALFCLCADWLCCSSKYTFFFSFIFIYQNIFAVLLISIYVQCQYAIHKCKNTKWIMVTIYVVQGII